MSGEETSVCDIRIGTSGYDYPDWEGVFYPEGIGRSEYLGAYSEVFNTVELNFTYYGMPKADRTRGLLSRVRKPMDFAVKANQALTHKIDPGTWADSVAEFSRGIEPLAAAKCLCAVLLEFPFSFHYEEDERRYLDKIIRALSPFPLVVEFRNAEWINARVIEGLKTRGVALCMLDMPRLEGLPPTYDIVTSKLAYLRFHGRNGAMWWDGNAEERYDYHYSKDELSSWVSRAEAIMTQAEILRIFFNNHRKANAALNAQDFIHIARAAKLL